jgi:hypothetical protein
MGSENLTGADNQQETPSPCNIVLDPNWIVGFVDGEGCFSVSVHRNAMMHRHGGWQLLPVFHIYQHQDHREILEAMVPVFGCGQVRPKGPNWRWQYCRFFRAVSPGSQSKRLPDICRHRTVDAQEGAFDGRWVRAPGATCVWHECQWQATLEEY